ncbi:MAG: arginine decarboxylase [Bacteroidota bacterium]|nr:arginine decarboxylase [Bacteroidota bacterium]MDX5431378.1 arginine decarboxylase [Bacteroidota bacterium]MDX5470108.1 arginine decarboxylase [Bacteroidota bacterium]
MLKNRYIDLIEQTFYFPRHGFNVVDNELSFHDVPLMELIEKYGTPLKLTYLPKISSQIQKAKRLFNEAIEKHGYAGTYQYCYCTKSSHFSFVMNEALKNDIHLETSSDFDIHIIRDLHKKGKYSNDRYIVCNGYKTPEYVQNMVNLVEEGFTNLIAVLDNPEEINQYAAFNTPMNLGIRVATEEEPNYSFYTSRLGMSSKRVLDFYRSKIKEDNRYQLKMMHFFINTGIKDTTYYWSELARLINVYCDLKKECPELNTLDIGGGMPIYTSLGVEHDYAYMIDQIVYYIKTICDDRGVPVPHIFTEFGSYTVAESGAVIYSILGKKQQNDTEQWYMIDSSFITTLPDTWGIGQKFILLAINHWDKTFQRTNLGGITCDGQDFYNSDTHTNQVFMPKVGEGEKLYMGFFHTGAYQESIGGYGGIQHCLIPAPKHVLLQRDEKGNLIDTLFAGQQGHEEMMRILGY